MKKPRCEECFKKTTDENVATWICKECDSKLDKPVRMLWIAITGLIIFFYWVLKENAIAMITGIFIGIIMTIVIKKERKKRK